MSKLGVGERAAWGNFPAVIRNNDLGALKKDPDYLAAKQGDNTAALNVISRLLTDEMVEKLRSVIGNDRPRLLPVMAVEAAGNNKLPLAMAIVLGDRLGLPVELGITQREKVARTDAGADHRLAFNPSFSGNVVQGQSYIVLDDTLTMGGTIASLRGYVENRGGKVVAASVMSAHVGAVDLAVKPGMLVGIAAKHGDAVDTFWKQEFGYGLDKLTQGEAGHLKAAKSFDAIRSRIAEARYAVVSRLDDGRTATPQAVTTAAGPGTQGETGRLDVPGEVPGAGDVLLTEAQEAERQQQDALENAPIEQTYQETLAFYVQAKHDQVERIEDRLEHLIDRSQAQLQQTQNNPPGLFSRPGSKKTWQAQQAQQQGRIQTLHNRLEAIREIKEETGLHSPRVEELATRKMRAEHPDLAADWDSMREAARREELTRKQAQQQERKNANERGGATQTLSITPLKPSSGG